MLSLVAESVSSSRLVVVTSIKTRFGNAFGSGFHATPAVATRKPRLHRWLRWRHADEPPVFEDLFIASVSGRRFPCRAPLGVLEFRPKLRLPDVIRLWILRACVSGYPPVAGAHHDWSGTPPDWNG